MKDAPGKDLTSLEDRSERRSTPNRRKGAPMRTDTFQAYFEALEDRWRWPPEAVAARAKFKARMWDEVREWTGRNADAFGEAIDALIADPFRANSRPSPEEIVQKARNLSQPRGTAFFRRSLPEDPEESERLLCAMFRNRKRPPEPPSPESRRKAEKLAAGLLAALDDPGAPSGEEVPF